MPSFQVWQFGEEDKLIILGPAYDAQWWLWTPRRREKLEEGRNVVGLVEAISSRITDSSFYQSQDWKNQISKRRSQWFEDVKHDQVCLIGISTTRLCYTTTYCACYEF